MSSNSTSKTWFITGSSRGFGRVWAQAALERGDRVAATARDPSSIAPLADDYGEAFLPLSLDVTDRSAVFDAVASARDRYGRVDVVVNNAGYGLFGMVEEITEAQARAQIETNLFGALWVTQAVLPIMREQRGGHILQVSSVGGIGAFPTLSLYNASKWGLEAMSEALAQEVADFGIRVTIIEPGPYGTDWSGSSAVHANPIAAYDAVREARQAVSASRDVGDPGATAGAILKVVDAEQPPLRLLLGTFPPAAVEEIYERRLATWRAWREVSEAAQR
ncbi:MAG: SDR family oxidoreductase [Solirubrobacterales bacterium]|nr:SDR family oxidoreductase [Solirubrobacterales bacterium]